MLAILNSLGAGEVIAILVIALIVLGPEKLPDAIRKFGNIYGELRRMSHGFQSELRDAFDEPLRELRGTAQMMQDAVNDPVQTAKTSMTAPVVGGGKKTETGPTVDEADTADEMQEPVGETQAPVDESGEPVATTHGATSELPDEAPAPSSVTVEAAAAEGNGGPPPAADDGQPVLAQAGLMVSEPELVAPGANGADASDAGAEQVDARGDAATADADADADHEAAAAGDSPRDR